MKNNRLQQQNGQDNIKLDKIICDCTKSGNTFFWNYNKHGG